MNFRILAPALAGALFILDPGLCGAGGVAMAAPAPAETQPALLWSNQALQGDAINTLVFWSPGLGLEPKIRVKPSMGKVQEIVASGNRITVTYKAPATDLPGRVHFQIKGKGEAGPVAGTVEVRLNASSLKPIQVEMDPPVFNFGDAGVRVRLTPPASTLDDGARHIQVRASMGTISEPMSTGDGSWVTRWEPPKNLDGSAIALITVSEPGHAENVVGSALIPIQVKRELPFQVPANSQNILRVGTREWGPIQADASGVVRFNAALDPQIVQGELQVISESANETRTVDLFWESPDVFALFPAPTTASADPTQPLTLHMLVMAPDGSPRRGTPPEVVVDHGSLGDITEAMPGYYQVELIPPNENREGQVEMRLDGQSISQPLNFVTPAGNTAVEVHWGPDNMTTQASAVLHDPPETQLSKESASFYVTGANLNPKAVFQPTVGSDVGVELLADTWDTVAVAWPSTTPTTGLPPVQLLAWVPAGSLPADGTGMTPLVTVAVDRFGHGVPGIALDYRVQTGGGWVTSSATTDPAGVAVVDYRAGRSFGPAQIVVRGKGLEQTAIVFQHAGVPDPPQPPEPTALEKSWMSRVSASRVSRARPADRPPPEIGPLAVPEPIATSTPTPTVASGPTPTIPQSEPSAESTATPFTESEAAPAWESQDAGVGPGMSMGALDVNAGLLVLSHRYDASSTANGYAPSASFDHSGIFGAPGLDLRVRLDINSEVAPDVRARIYTERMGAGESVPWNLEWAALVGASYGQELTHWFSWKGTGHLHRQTVGAFTYSNEARTELEMTPLSNWGLRLGAGAKFTVLEDGFLELEAAETFGLRPVDHYFGLTGGWKIDDRFTGTLGFDLDVRHLRATLDTGSLEIEDRVQGVRVGVQTTL